MNSHFQIYNKNILKQAFQFQKKNNKKFKQQSNKKNRT